MGADCDTNHCRVVAKVRERLATNKQEAQKFDVVRFYLRNTKGAGGLETVSD